jgi:4-phosphopantoate--beta-alanine ligase
MKVRRIPRSHPRYRSLMVRADLADRMAEGLVVPEGLMAHGRGEAFDYLLGERTTPEAARAERAAAAHLLLARRPALSVNGNVAALAADEVASLSLSLPRLAVEVNLFHRTPQRARLVAKALRDAGVPRVLGEHPTARLRGLASDRAWVDAQGILRADVVVVPLEDGDRAEALARAGKFVISVDLNPLSRTSRMAQLPIVDELTRALRHIRQGVGRMSGWDRSELRAVTSAVRPAETLQAALRRIRDRLDRLAGPGDLGGRPRRGG